MNTHEKFLRLSILLLCLYTNIFATSVFAQQIVGTSEGFNEEEIMRRVKQVDEFFKRFNYETDFEGKSMAGKFDNQERMKYVFSLFDTTFLAKTNQERRELIETFVKKACKDENGYFLNFNDGSWYADADCQVILNGKETSIKLLLKIERIDEKRNKWVIFDAISPILSLTPEPKELKTVISPVDHEINFMKLADLTEMYHAGVTHFAHSDYKKDELSVFFWLIKNRMLKIKHVENLVFHFETIPDFVFTVKHTERKGNNSGWLIGDLKAK